MTKLTIPIEGAGPVPIKVEVEVTPAPGGAGVQLAAKVFAWERAALITDQEAENLASALTRAVLKNRAAAPVNLKRR